MIQPQAWLQSIKARRLRPVYLFVGDDTVAIDRAIEAIEGTIDEADRAFAVERRYAGEPGGEPVEIVSAARMLPMLGDRRLVIVLRAERLLKPKRAGSAEIETDEENERRAEGASPGVDTSTIEDYLDAPVLSTTLVFVARDIDRTRRLTKRFLEKADLVVFAGLEAGGTDPRDQLRHASHIVEEIVTATNRSIDKDAVRALVSRTGGDVSKLRDDVEKLVLFVGGRLRITLDDVVEVVSNPNVSHDDWAIVNAIGAGDAARALAETGRRLDHGDSAHALVGQLRWWVSNRLAQSEPSRVKPALTALLRTDLALKSSGGDERVLIERLVAELTR